MKLQIEGYDDLIFGAKKLIDAGEGDMVITIASFVVFFHCFCTSHWSLERVQPAI